MNTIAAISGVDFVISTSDQYNVAKIIEVLCPETFTKGSSSRTFDKLDKEEIDACKRVGCNITCGVGGFDKTDSSSKIFERAVDLYERSRIA